VRIRFGLFTLDDRTRQLLKGERAVQRSPKALTFDDARIES